MEVVKKLCTFFQRGSELVQRRHEPRLQELPLEILLCILKLLPSSEAAGLRKECKALRLAAAISVRDALRSLRLEVRDRTASARDRVVSIVLDHRMVHPGLLASLLAWRSIQTDLSLLNLLVWRYRNDMDVWCPLSSLLGPVLEELSQEVKDLAQEEWKTSRKKLAHPHLDNFLKRFTDEIEVHFYSSEMLASFEIRLIDLLLCCPCGNLKLVISHGNRGHKRIEMYCELRNLKETSVKVGVSDENTRCENEREILRFMRDYIRSANIAYVQSVIKKIENYGKNIDDLAFSSELREIISFISAGDESCLKHEERTLKNGDVEEIYEGISTTDVAKNGLYCSFEVANGEHNCGKGVFGKEVTCVACTHPTINNAFSLGITSGRNSTNYIKEIFVMYEPEKANYSLSTYKHMLI